MLFNTLRVNWVYSKRVTNGVPGNLFVIYKPYTTYVYYRFWYYMKHAYPISIIHNHKKLGVAVIIAVNKIKFENIREDWLLYPKDQVCEKLNIPVEKTIIEVIFRWVKSRNKKVFKNGNIY